MGDMLRPLRTAGFAAAFALPTLYSSAVAAPIASRLKTVAFEEPAHELAPPVPRAEPSVVLVVLDGVRWQEIANGYDRSEARRRHISPNDYDTGRKLVPNIYRLAERGALLGLPDGTPIEVSGPNFISLPGYMEILGGRPYAACDSNACRRPPWAPLPDLLRQHGFQPSEVAVFSSWHPILHAASAAPSDLITSCGRDSTSHPELVGDAEFASIIADGDKQKPTPGDDDYRPDAYTAKAALRFLETEHPRFQFIGLGDTDEYAHMNDYKRYLDALHAADAVIGEVLDILDRSGAYGRHTSVFVTTDHGRASNFRDHGREFPEAARVWLAAGGGGLHAHHASMSSRPHTLSDIAPTVLHLLGVNSEIAAMSGVPMDDLYSRGAVATR